MPRDRRGRTRNGYRGCQSKRKVYPSTLYGCATWAPVLPSRKAEQSIDNRTMRSGRGGAGLLARIRSTERKPSR